MKKTIRDRSIFTVIACIALAVCLLVPNVRVKQVELAPEMAELVGEERAEAFSKCMKELQGWYYGKTITTEGVVVTQAEYQQMADILSDCVTYLDRGELTMEALPSEMQTAYETADMNLAYLMVGAVIPLINVMGSQESYACDQDIWISIGEALDSTVDLYRTIAAA